VVEEQQPLDITRKCRNKILAQELTFHAIISSATQGVSSENLSSNRAEKFGVYPSGITQRGIGFLREDDLELIIVSYPAH
jgi:hypothetical protein